MSSHLHTSMPEPLLPPELEWKICQLAITDSSDSHTVYDTIRVARRFREWFERELYRIIMCSDYEATFPPIYLTQPFLSHARNFAPRQLSPMNIPLLQKWGPYVRHILIEEQPLEEVRVILEHCPYVENLAIWLYLGYQTDNGVIDWIDRLKHLKRLSFSVGDLFPCLNPSELSESGYTIPLNRPSFLGLTHLEIRALPRYNQASWNHIQELAYIPYLTHFISCSDISSSGFLGVLRSCRNIQLVIPSTGRPGYRVEGEVDELEKDKRFVNRNGNRSKYNSSGWERDVRGIESYWTAVYD